MVYSYDYNHAFCRLLYSILLVQGLDSGLSMEDDIYNVYDKPWRGGGGAAQAIYRPSRNADKDIYGDDVEKLIKTSRSVTYYKGIFNHVE